MQEDRSPAEAPAGLLALMGCPPRPAGQPAAGKASLGLLLGAQPQPQVGKWDLPSSRHVTLGSSALCRPLAEGDVAENGLSQGVGTKHLPQRTPKKAKDPHFPGSP